MGPCSCHVHLLLSEPQQEYAGRCAEAVKSRSFAAFDCDANHFWQKRYYDINIRYQSSVLFCSLSFSATCTLTSFFTSWMGSGLS